MVKHFRNFPSEFEQYNPEVFQLAENELRTLDSKGQLHSFEDNPALIIKRDCVPRIIGWYSHGKEYRKDGRPSQIIMTPRRYESRDASFATHSDGDFPATITYYSDIEEFWLNWYKKGKSHRENGLPAQIVTSPHGNRYFYHINDYRHRDGDLPAFDTPDIKEWYFLNRLHNSSGPAIVETNGSKKWFLFGAKIREQTFNSIIAYRKATNVPLWVAFLVFMKMTSEASVQSLFNDEGKWEVSLPINWVLHFLKVTSASMMEAESDFKAHRKNKAEGSIKYSMDGRLSTTRTSQKQADFSDFLKIGLFLEHNISFEEEEKLKVKPNYEF
jgi:hypothetical protein